jgi:hypothetical protein
MRYKSVCLALSFGELTPTPMEKSRAAENYAIAFCSRERAHLSVFMAAPNLRIPSAGFIPLAHALVDEISAERRIHAEAAEKRITSAAMIAGITVKSSSNPIRTQIIASPWQRDLMILSSFYGR